MHKLFLLIILSGAVSCNVAPSSKLSNGYFDLDSLLSSQVRLLAGKSVEVEKVVIIDGKTEKQTFAIDPQFLQKEFQLFRDFNPNQSRYVNAYEVLDESETKRYVPRLKEKIPLRSLRLTYREGSLHKVEGELVENTSVYSTSKRCFLEFDGNVLHSYSIAGYQQVLLSKDTSRFDVSGEIQDLR